MTSTTDPRLLALLPCQGLEPEAECWDRLHQAYSRWMATNRSYTSDTVAVLYALSCRTWDAHQRAQVVAFTLEQGRRL